MATTIIRGTTPTIRFHYKNVHIEDITAAYLTIKQNKEVIVEKDMSEANIGEDSMSWLLSQEETLGFKVGKVAIMHNWLLADGTRGASKENFIAIEDNHIDEVI